MNHTIITKLQHSLSFLLDYAMYEDESQQEEADLIEELSTENSGLRNVLMLQSDYDSIEIELKRDEVQYMDHLVIGQNSLAIEQALDVRAMIAKASEEIKQTAIKRKEIEKQESLHSNMSSLSLDGKPEEFPFKNIKPKKMYLLTTGS